MPNNDSSEDSAKRAISLLSHELRAHLVGIRAAASFLQRRITVLDEAVIVDKLDEICYGCESLLFELETFDVLYELYSASEKQERLSLLRVLLEAVKAMRPLLIRKGFSVSQIELDADDLRKVTLIASTQEIRLVLFHLLRNSIMYARKEPGEFKIRIETDETNDNYIIKFKDWGLGIRPEHKDQVFLEGFRTSEGWMESSGGLGLGLAASKKVLQRLGGDLILTHEVAPTEFHMILPKKSMKTAQ